MLLNPLPLEKGNEIVPQEASNLKGQLRLHRMPPYEAESIVSYKQVTLVNAK